MFSNPTKKAAEKEAKKAKANAEAKAAEQNLLDKVKPNVMSPHDRYFYVMRNQQRRASTPSSVASNGSSNSSQSATPTPKPGSGSFNY